MTDNVNNTFDDSADNIIRELRSTFREEAYELLAELEHALLELEKDPGDSQQIGRVFRAMHTIKGSGGACEFHEISAFTHELETIFDKLRSGKMQVTKEIITLTLSARDQIEAMFDAYYRSGKADPAKTKEILSAFKKLLPEKTIKAKAGSRAAPPAGKKEDATRTTYRVRFRPTPEIFTQGINPVQLLNELRELGTCRVVARPESIPYLEDLDPQACHAGWDAILSTARGMDAVQDVFIFVKDSAEVKIEIIDIDEEDGTEDEKTCRKLADILEERSDATCEDLKRALAKKKEGSLPAETGASSGPPAESGAPEQQHAREQRHTADSVSSIRVATGKLDSLVNLVGELVTVQARLSQTALNTGVPALVSIAEEVERLTVSLRENAMSIRMLPIGTTFSKFRRVVRDLSTELGKEIEMIADGAETELDKTVIERLSDPLVHIIRNSIDHGIETPEARTAAGKPKKGTVHLSAVHSGAHVLITVKDDGVGLDAAAIRAKAVEKGLIPPEAELTEREVMELILAPGFSTAKNVTGISGRGVGMDVVKRAIDELRGTIEIGSTPGTGTAITLKLPLTLAIIDGFLTKISGEHFIFPLSLVQECIELPAGEATHGRHLVNVRGHIVPYIYLREYFSIDGERPDFEQIVIVNVDGRRVGLVVDGVIGEHQTVLKSLGRYYYGVEGISGATIMGDGTVALILDIPKLVRLVEQQESQAARGGRPS